MKKLTMRTIALVLVIASLMSMMIMSAEAADTGTYNTKAVYLRVAADANAKYYGKVNKGTTCNILSEKTVKGVTWYKVKITSKTTNDGINLKGKTGWSMAEFIDKDGSGSNTKIDKPADKGSLNNGYIKVDKGSVNVRSLPGTTKSSIVTTLKTDRPVLYYTGEHSADNFQWYHIIQPVDGYVASTYVKDGGTIGHSASGIPYCKVCGKSMVRDEPIDWKKTKREGNRQNGYIWDPAVARYSYCCSNINHKTSAIIDGPAVKGREKRGGDLTKPIFVPD